MEANRSIALMGTTIRLQVVHSKAEWLIDQAVQQLYDYEARFSANRTDSLLAKINQQAGLRPVKVDRDLYELIKLGKSHSLASHGRLNIAIGPLVQLWRIGFSDARRPSDAEIQQVLPLVDPQQIQLNDRNQSVYLTQTGMKIDLGAVAKGFFADQIIAYFKQANCQSAMINLGGNLLTYGPVPGKKMNAAWRVGIQDPKQTRGQNRLIIGTYNQSVVTSGVYERKLTVDGQTYHHIFDSTTGYPVESQIESLTIISNRSIDGELWTTRLFSCSPLTIMQTVEPLEGIEAIVITQDRRILATPGAKKLILSVRQ